MGSLPSEVYREMPLVVILVRFCKWFLPSPLGDGVYTDLNMKQGRRDFVLMELTMSLLGSFTACNAAVAIYFYRNHNPDPIDKTPVLLTGALFTFLVPFRAGQSYSRWFEGRCHMGKIHASLRALSLYVNGAASTMELRLDTATEQDELDECNLLRKDPHRLLSAVFRACVLHVREDKSNESLEKHLNSAETKLLNGSIGARPMFVLQLLIARLARLNQKDNSKDFDLTSDYRMSLQEVGQIVSSFNGADKLVNTPSPNFYLYLLFLVYVYWGWGMLPWCLASYNHDNYWQSTVEGFLISYTFCFLVTLAIDMDNPFDGGMVDLPLEKYEAGLLKDLAVVLGIDTDGDGTIDEEVTHESNQAIGVKSDIGSLEVISPRADVVKKEA